MTGPAQEVDVSMTDQSRRECPSPNESGTQSCGDGPTISHVRIMHVPEILDLIVDAAGDGHFNDKYHNLRHKAALGRELFRVRFLRRLLLHDGSLHRAELRVAERGGQFRGFCLSRGLAAGDWGSDREIYLFGVVKADRCKGIGTALMTDLVERTPQVVSLHALCLPASGAMMHLLQKFGFNFAGELRAPGVTHALGRFVRAPRNSGFDAMHPDPHVAH
jgi:ribosomal protein S18 acetylase RimI-like enzyme